MGGSAWNGKYSKPNTVAIWEIIVGVGQNRSRMTSCKQHWSSFNAWTNQTCFGLTFGKYNAQFNHVPTEPAFKHIEDRIRRTNIDGNQGSWEYHCHDDPDDDDGDDDDDDADDADDDDDDNDDDGDDDNDGNDDGDDNHEYRKSGGGKQKKPKKKNKKNKTHKKKNKKKNNK